MAVREQEIRIYRTRGGKRPFTQWFDNLRDRIAQQRTDARLARVQLGNFGDAESVGRGVLELRVDFGPGYRVYFGRDGDHVIVLLIGGDKRTQPNDIARAQEY